MINDLGLVGTSDPSTGDVGWALPLSRSSVLCIYPKVSRAVAHHRGGWWAVIEHRALPIIDGGGTNGFNDFAAKAAGEFVAAAVWASLNVTTLRATIRGHESSSRSGPNFPSLTLAGLDCFDPVLGLRLQGFIAQQIGQRD